MESRREPSVRPKGGKTVALFGLSYQFLGDASTAGSSPCLPLLFSFLKSLFSTAPNHPDHPTHPQFPQPSPPPIPPLFSYNDSFQFLKWVFSSHSSPGQLQLVLQVSTQSHFSGATLPCTDAPVYTSFYIRFHCTCLQSTHLSSLPPSTVLIDQLSA